MTFQDFKFKENLQKAIDEAGFKEPSPIQIDRHINVYKSAEFI